MAPAWQADLETAHAALMNVVPLVERVEPSPGLPAVARALERALGALYDANDGRDEPLQALTRAAAEVDSARRSLDDHDGLMGNVADGLARVASALGAAQEACAKQPAARPNGLAAGPLLASAQLPRLHACARASLSPKLRVHAPPEPPPGDAYAPLPSPKTYEELETWGQRAAEHIKGHLKNVLDREGKTQAPPPPPPSGPPVFVRQWARECFEEIAMLSSQRRPLLGDDWQTSLELEQRMLWTLDAFASLGPVALAEVEGLVLDAPAADPPRAFAAGFLLGSVDGRDTLGLAERIARWFSDDDALERFGDALLVAPHPHAAGMLEQWLDDSDPSYRAVAARVLAGRRQLSAERMVRCLGDRPEIAAHVLVPLAIARDPAVEHAIHDALASPHAGLRQQGWLALALRSRPQAAERLRIELGGAHTDRAAPLLAAVGSRDDARRLREHALRAPTPALLDAVGAAGSIDAVPALLELLGHDDADVALGAAGALERITGAPLRRDVDLDPDKVDDRDLPEPDTGGFAGPPLPLRLALSDPRHAPSEGSPDTVELPPPDPELWRAWWQEHRARFAPDKRYRMGQPFSALVAWQELAGPTLSYAQRRRSARELTALLQDDGGFSPDAFVVEQREALRRWRPLAEKRVAATGAWPS